MFTWFSDWSFVLFQTTTSDSDEPRSQIKLNADGGEKKMKMFSERYRL